MKINYKLIIIIVLALFLRIYLLDKLPPGLHRDEASTGYNSFLILKTGQDEYQRTFPLAFEAFGDWKRPINIYLTVPSKFLNSVRRGKLSWDGFQSVISFKNYYFIDNIDSFDLSKKNSLFVAKIDYNNQDNLKSKWTKIVALPNGQAYWFMQVTEK